MQLQRGREREREIVIDAHCHVMVNTSVHCVPSASRNSSKASYDSKIKGEIECTGTPV